MKKRRHHTSIMPDAKQLATLKAFAAHMTEFSRKTDTDAKAWTVKDALFAALNRGIDNLAETVRYSQREKARQLVARVGAARVTPAVLVEAITVDEFDDDEFRRAYRVMVNDKQIGTLTESEGNWSVWIEAGPRDERFGTAVGEFAPLDRALAALADAWHAEVVSPGVRLESLT